MPQHGSLLVEVMVTGPFQENCYLVADAASKDAIAIDPGDEAERVLGRVRELGWHVGLIFATHGHLDHVGAIASLKRLLGVPFAIHPSDLLYVENMPQQAASLGLGPIEAIPTIDHELAPGEQLRVGALCGEVLFTPGHSPGGCCLYFRDAGVVFVGDSLFAGSIGRTDLPGGDHAALLSSIREKLLTLPDSVIVYSGHGAETTIGTERRTNWFLR